VPATLRACVATGQGPFIDSCVPHPHPNAATIVDSTAGFRPPGHRGARTQHDRAIPPGTTSDLRTLPSTSTIVLRSLVQRIRGLERCQRVTVGQDLRSSGSRQLTSVGLRPAADGLTRPPLPLLLCCPLRKDPNRPTLGAHRARRPQHSALRRAEPPGSRAGFTKPRAATATHGFVRTSAAGGRHTASCCWCQPSRTSADHVPQL